MFFIKYMFTQIYLYIINYVLTILALFLYFFVYNASGTLVQKTFAQAWNSNTLYYKQGWIFKFLIFQLSGLPPVFFFFVKFSFLITSLIHVNFFLFFLIFINILLSIFFYLKIFSNTSSKTSNKLLKDSVINNPIISNSKKIFVKRVYKGTYYIVFFIFLNLFSAFFFLDLYVMAYAYLMF